MTVVEPHIEKFQHIDPQQVETYLVAHGWKQQQKHGDKASIWTLDGFEILLPLKPEIIDFKRRMAEVVETLALAENRSLSRNIRRLNNRGAVSTTIQFVFHPHRHPQRRFQPWRNHTPKYSCEQTTPHPYRTRADRDYILALKAYKNAFPYTAQATRIKENGT